MLPSPNPDSLRILYAEDDPRLTSIVMDVLRQVGHQPASARNGKEALEILSRDVNAFDLILTDNQMPLLSGLDIAARARSSGFKRYIIVMSSPLDEASKAAYRSYAVDTFIEKDANMLQALLSLSAICGGQP